MTEFVDQDRLLLVKTMTWEAEGVVSLLMVDPSGAELPAWEPGAHIDLSPEDTAGAARRQYSLCGDPNDRNTWRVAVLAEPRSRGGSSWVHERLRPGHHVRVSLPRNHFALDDATCTRLLIAGGIGITPVMAMARELERRGDDWTLAYGGRRLASMAFREELEQYGKRVRILPEDSEGLLPLESLLAEQPADVVVYCCGPEPLLTAVENICATRGVTLHIERFTAEKETHVEGELDSFDVEAAVSGVTITVAAGVSIIDALEQNGVTPAASCLEGTCGTCETRVIDGVPAHHDVILTDEERAAGDIMMICVGRSRTERLVLDL